MKLVQYLISSSLYPLAYIKYSSLSAISWFKALFSPPKILFEADYSGEKILLLALYEKGILRPDIMNLLARAKEAGFYVLAVNTRKLKQPHDLRHLIDCYIEKFNHGRDFGSYKAGFLHVFSRKWAEQCPRLLMLNDSVFFVDKHLPAFLSVMSSSEHEVLGTTENFEIEYHLGSFAISMAQPILMHKAFRKFWRTFSASDLRPKNIKKGEMGLTRVLSQCAGSSQSIKAYFDVSFVDDFLMKNPKLVDYVYQIQPTSLHVHWERVEIKDLFHRIAKQYFYSPEIKALTDASDEVKSMSLRFQQSAYRVQAISSVSTLLSIAENQGLILTEQQVFPLAVALFLKVYVSGSQIHHNAAFLLIMGCPIVKLDLLYRGAVDQLDLHYVREQLDADDRGTIFRLLMARPFGKETLQGLELSAFNRGLV